MRAGGERARRRSEGAGHHVRELRPEFRRRYATAETDEVKVGNTVRQALKRALGSCTRHGFYVASWDGEEWLWRLDR